MSALANIDWNSRGSANDIAADTPFPVNREDISMREKLTMVRGATIVFAVQMIFRAMMVLRNWNY
ncbi:MAG: hypothetical protein ACRD4Q_01240 [Candidatus Acidiferrales bacterium]